MKKLLKKKQELIQEMAQMLDTAEAETRALDVEAYEAKEKELRDLEETIKKLETRDKGDQKKIETRNHTEELRTLTTATTAQVVPTVLFDEIVKKVKERSNLINSIEMIKCNGDLEFVIEENSSNAQFLSETADCTNSQVTFRKVKAMDKRLGKLIRASKKLLNNSPSSFSVGYLTDHIADAMMGAIEQSLITEKQHSSRNADELSYGIFSTTSPVINSLVQGVLEIEDILRLVSAMKQANLEGSKFIMNRDMFTRIFAMTDGNGRPFMVTNVINDKVVYSLLGMDVLISEYAPAEKICLVNPKAMKLKIGQEMNIVSLVEKYATTGEIGIYAEAFLDAVIVDNEKIRVLNIGTR